MGQLIAKAYPGHDPGHGVFWGKVEECTGGLVPDRYGQVEVMRYAAPPVMIDATGYHPVSADFAWARSPHTGRVANWIARSISLEFYCFHALTC